MDGQKVTVKDDYSQKKKELKIISKWKQKKLGKFFHLKRKN